MSDQVEPGTVGSVAAQPGPAELAGRPGYVPQNPQVPVVYPHAFHGHGRHA